MAPTKRQGASNHGPDLDEDEISFAQQQKRMSNEAKARRENARAKIRKDHDDRHKDLEQRIRNLKRQPSNKRPSSATASASPNDVAYATLRSLLTQKRNVETRISLCMENLEKAMNTTSRELQIALKSRSDAMVNGSSLESKT